MQAPPDSEECVQRAIRIIVDDRESRCPVIDVFREDKSVEILIRRLPIGDYEIDGRLLVERKTLLDFVSSIKDGRLFRQACRMAASPLLRPLLILEGTLSDLASCGMQREALQGALITLNLILGIPVLRAKDPRESARLMLFAARQIMTFASGAIPRKGKRPRGKRKTQLEILQGLPNIGPERAANLLEAFGTVEQVISASLDQLLTVPAVGPVTAKAIRWAVSEDAGKYQWVDDQAPIV